ncbi:hypothetical protein BY996DRAFT_8543010 [Phakopsora pachyrhizi]|nr:hypothetical protein BY996DRAFT_8543010 [Phakopsora pachyrhizi]
MIPATPCSILLVHANGVSRKSAKLIAPRRFQHDLVRQSATAKVIQLSGPLGQHSNSGLVATVFGATGFLGRYLVHKLAKKDTQVIVPYQEEDSKQHLCVIGDLSQFVPLEFDLQNETLINKCV